MPRQRREKGETGLYHIMLRGIDRRVIFEDEEDDRKFLSLLERFKGECGFELPGYCLMSNHVHLLMREKEVPLETIFRKLGAAYVYYFNHRYDRVGPLFQDRFRSEIIRDDPQLLQTLRYIHRNPVKAGICEAPEAYAFSSYRQYLGKGEGPADTGFILGMMSKRALIRFTKEAAEDMVMDMPDHAPRRPTDREAASAVERILKERGVSDIHALGRAERDALLVELRRQGLSLTQISRLTGFSRSIISRAGMQ